MERRKSRIAATVSVLAWIISFGCGGDTRDGSDFSEAGIFPPNERPRPPQNFASALKGTEALSSADFLIVRKSDGSRIDLLATKGSDIEKTFGPTIKTIRLDARDFEAGGAAIHTNITYIINVEKHYQSLVFDYDENVNSGNIKEVRIDGPEYETARGLSVGDTIEKLYERYLVTNRVNLLFDLPEEISWMPDDPVAPVHFRYKKFFQFELCAPSLSYYDKNVEGDTLFLGMNVFVDAAGKIVHIDFYHEGGN